MSEPLPSTTMLVASTASSTAASPLGIIKIRPLSRRRRDTMLTNEDAAGDLDASSSSFGWGDFPLITASSASPSSSSSAAASWRHTTTRDDRRVLPLADDVFSNTNTNTKSPSCFDIVVHPLNDDTDDYDDHVDMILFRGPRSSSSRKEVTAMLLCSNNSTEKSSSSTQQLCDGDVSETERRTSACSSSSNSDDDTSEESVAAALKKRRDKVVQECRHVQFATVSVREHAVTIGSHPYCTGAYPLTLDWPHATTETSSLSSHGGAETGGAGEYEYTIDEYEEQQEQKRARRRRNSLQRVQPSCQRREASSISIVHSFISPQQQQQQQQQQTASRLRQKQLPFRLSALERRARLATVRGASFAALQEEEFQRCREEQKAALLRSAAHDDVGGDAGLGRGLVRTASMNSLVYSSTSSLIRRQQEQFRLHSSAAATASQIKSPATVVGRQRDALFL